LSSRCRISHGSLGTRPIGWTDEHGNASSSGHQLADEIQPLCHQLRIKKIDTGQIAARPRDICDKSELGWVFGGDKRDPSGRRPRL
jgi:hypothetical protein